MSGPFPACAPVWWLWACTHDLCVFLRVTCFTLVRRQDSVKWFVNRVGSAELCSYSGGTTDGAGHTVCLCLFVSFWTWLHAALRTIPVPGETLIPAPSLLPQLLSAHTESPGTGAPGRGGWADWKRTLAGCCGWRMSGSGRWSAGCGRKRRRRQSCGGSCTNVSRCYGAAASAARTAGRIAGAPGGQQGCPRSRWKRRSCGGSPKQTGEVAHLSHRWIKYTVTCWHVSLWRPSVTFVSFMFLFCLCPELLSSIHMRSVHFCP